MKRRYFGVPEAYCRSVMRPIKAIELAMSIFVFPLLLASMHDCAMVMHIIDICSLGAIVILSLEWKRVKYNLMRKPCMTSLLSSFQIQVAQTQVIGN